MSSGRRATRSGGSGKTAKPKEFAFVLGDPHGVPKAADRKLIRSHVMRGKNTREKPSPELPAPWIHATATATSRSQRPLRPGSEEDDRGEDADTPLAAQLNSSFVERVQNTRRNYPNQGYSPWLPIAVDQLDTVQLAENVDKQSRQMLVDFFGTLKEVMYPLDLCCDFDVSKTSWFYWMINDAAYLHSLLWTVSFFYDAVAGRPPQQRTSYHVVKTIRLLNQRLVDRELAISDSTIAVIMSMALLSEYIGDSQASQAHAAGLRHLVAVRGGIQSFSHNQQLQVKICRVDLNLAMSTGIPPSYFVDTISWDSVFDSSHLLARLRPDPSPGQAKIRRTIKAIDRKLYLIFRDMQDFTQITNFLFQSGQKMQPRVFQDLLTSMQYRLLLREFTGAEESLAELLRLAMLAYMTVMLLRLPYITLRYPFLGKNLRTACQTFEPKDETERYIFAWVLFIGLISVLGPDDEEMGSKMSEMLEPCLGSTWKGVNARLKDILWIDLIHNPAGQKLFEKHSRQEV